MLKIIVFGTVVLLICMAGWGIYRITKPHQDVSGEEAAATLSAINLYTEFEQGENQANKKWVGKVIAVTGNIASLSETESNLSITLEATPKGGINCSISKKEMKTLIKWKKGDTITIRGKCSGFLMDVNLVDCVIQN